MIDLKFNAAPVFAALDRARGVLDAMEPVYEDIAEYMVKATKRRFVDGTGPDGKKWLDKSPTTLATYLARSDGDRPDPLIGPSKRLSTEIAELVTRGGAEIGSALEYSGVMQRGAAKGAFGIHGGRPVPWGDIPARVWLGISATDETTILDIVDEHLETAVEG